MRSIVLLATLLLPAVAAAQTAPPGTTTPGPARVPLPPRTTAAPVPGVGPGVPATGSAAVTPEQVAPSGYSAGPADSTPFSSTPSGELPSGMSLPYGRNPPGGASSTSPNLSR